MRPTDVIKLPCIDDNIVLSASISALLMSSLGRYSLTGSEMLIRNDRIRLIRNNRFAASQTSMA